MRGKLFGGAIFLATAVPVSAGAEAIPQGSVFGVWMNPEKTAKVEMRPCGQLACGAVVWASQEALLKAKKAGTDPLIGVELLSDYRPTSKGRWQGRVFVPDLNVRLFSRIEPVGADAMKISGCIFGGLVCMSRVWTRVEPIA